LGRCFFFVFWGPCLLFGNTTKGMEAGSLLLVGWLVD
jgi:hypothetical protein